MYVAAKISTDVASDFSRFYGKSIKLQVLCYNTINRPHSIYQSSNMALRLSGQTPLFGVVFVFFFYPSLFGESKDKIDLQF